MALSNPSKRIALVTGAAGFIGSHLVDALLLQGLRVVGLDNLTTGNKTNLSTALEHEKFQLIEGDIRKADAVKQACENAEFVFHLAAATLPAESVRSPQKYHDINVEGTRIVLTEAAKAKVKRILFTSSAAVYGTPETVPTPEEVTLNPLSPYGVSKIEGEKLCQTVSAEQGICIPQLRFFNIYGPRQSSKTEAAVISIFLERSQQGLPLIIYGDGHQTRDFIYIEDVIRAYLQAATLKDLPSVPINVGTGIPVSILELAEEIRQQVPSCSSDIQFEAPRAGDIYHSYANIERMQQLLQYTPQIPLSEGIAKTFQSSLQRIE